MPEQFTQGPSILQSDIVNNLTTDSSTKPLSAAQGKVLKDTADTIDSNLTKSIKSVCPIAEGNTHSAFVAGMVIYIRNHPTLTEGSYTVTQYVAKDATLSDSNVTYNYYGGLDVLNSKLGKQMKVYATTGNIWLNSLTWTHGWNGSYTAPMPAPSGITINHLYAITLQGVNSFTTDFVVPWINGTTISLHSNREWSQDPSASCGYVILYD